MTLEKKLYVGNLPFSTTEEELKKFFSEEDLMVVEIHIITDRETGRSRGFGFVELVSEDQADQAIKSLNEKTLKGRELKISKARPQREF